MKRNSFFLLTVAAFLSVAFAALLAHAQDLGDTISAPGLFSYQEPKGWTARDTTFSKYKIAFDAPKDNFSANINVVVENFSGPLDKYVAANKTNLKASTMFENLQIVEEAPFTTTAGVTGVRLLITDTLGKADLQQVFYIFAGTGDTKFVVTATSLPADGDRYAPIFDASMKTFSPK